MRDFLYDLRRTFTGKFTIVAIVFIILVSVGVGYLFTAGSGSGGTPSIQTMGSYHYDNKTDTYNVSVFAFNQYGQPTNSLTIYTERNNTYQNGTTNSYGFYNFSYHSTNTTQFLEFSARPISTLVGFANNMYMTSNPKLQFNQIFISEVTRPGTTNQQELLLFYSSANGSAAPPLYVYYSIYNATSGNPPPTKINNMTKFSTIGNFYYTTLFINPPQRSAREALEVAIFNSTNSSAKPLTSISPYEPMSAIATLGLATSSFAIYGEIFGLFIPVLASLSAYFYFGKDKASGVLESVITRPVTKGRIIMSRYIANVGSMLVAFAVGAVIFELFLHRGTGSYLPVNYLALLIWTYLVEIAAFTGLIYLISQFLRSQGAILGVAIGIFMVFGFFWSTAISPLLLLYVFHVQAGTNLYTHYSIILDAISPSGYTSLVTFLLASTNVFGITVNTTTFGVTKISVAIIGIVWVIIPILLGFVFGRKKD